MQNKQNHSKKSEPFKLKTEPFSSWMNLWHVCSALIPQYLWLFQNSRLILNCYPLFHYDFSKRTVHMNIFLSPCLPLPLSLSNNVHVLVPAHSQQWDCNVFQIQRTHLCAWKSSIQSHQWQQQHLQLLLSGCREAYGRLFWFEGQRCLSNEKREQVTELDVSIHEFVA